MPILKNTWIYVIVSMLIQIGSLRVPEGYYTLMAALLLGIFPTIFLAKSLSRALGQVLLILSTIPLISLFANTGVIFMDLYQHKYNAYPDKIWKYIHGYQTAYTSLFEIFSIPILLCFLIKIGWVAYKKLKAQNL